jgi:hypothetical protein
MPIIKVSRTDGRSENFQLNTDNKLDSIRTFLTGKKIMDANDVFLSQGAEVDREQESDIALADVLKDNGLSIGESTPDSNIGGDDMARYTQLRDDQKRAIFSAIQIFRGLTFDEDGVSPGFNDLYAWPPGYLPVANVPRINTELTSSYSFSKVTSDLHVYGSNSTSVSFSSPYASGEAEFKHEQSKTTTSSKVTEYVVTRYTVRKVILKADPAKLIGSTGFVAAVAKAVTGNEDSRDGYENLMKVLNQWGFYVPVQFTLGGVIYSRDTTEIDDYSLAESQKDEFSGSFKAQFDGIGGGAAYKEAHGSDSTTTSSTKNQNTQLQLIGGKPGTEKDYPAWASSLNQPIAWQLAETQQLYPSLMLLNTSKDGRNALQAAIRIIDRFAAYPGAATLQPYLDMSAYNMRLQELLNPF